jgi:hypothetical protein
MLILPSGARNRDPLYLLCDIAAPCGLARVRAALEGSGRRPPWRSTNARVNARSSCGIGNVLRPQLFRSVGQRGAFSIATALSGTGHSAAAGAFPHRLFLRFASRTSLPQRLQMLSKARRAIMLLERRTVEAIAAELVKLEGRPQLFAAGAPLSGQ